MSITAPITFEQFEKLQLPESRKWELHEGELVEMPPPSFLHKVVQHRLYELLKPLFQGKAVVLTEMPISMKDKKNDYRSMDVGVLSVDRAPLTADQRLVNGAPELVIEVLSPSNTAGEIAARKRFCLENGAEMFAVVDAVELDVTVTYRSDPARTEHYGLGSSVPIRALGVEAELPVDAIFEGITSGE